MSPGDRYDMMMDSAMEAAYKDEMEKLSFSLSATRLLPMGARVGGLQGLRQAFNLSKAVPATAMGRRLARQIYAWTGKLPGVKRSDKALMSERLKQLEVKGALKRTPTELQTAAGEKAKKSWFGRKTPEATAKRTESIKKRLQAEEILFEATKGTFPGLFKGLATKPGQTLGAGYKSMTPAGKALFGGFTGLELAQLRDLPDLPPEERAARVAAAAAGAPLWAASGGLPFVQQMGAWWGVPEALRYGISRGGRALRGGKAAPTKPPTADVPIRPPRDLTVEDVQSLRQAIQHADTR